VESDSPPSDVSPSTKCTWCDREGANRIRSAAKGVVILAFYNPRKKKTLCNFINLILPKTV